MSDFTPKPETPDAEELNRRLDLLERENDRLRRQMEELVGPDNPCFDRMAFMRALRFYILILMIPLELMMIPLAFAGMASRMLASAPMLGPIPVYNFAGMGTSHPGIGLGLLAFGGVGIGVVGLGGLGIGVIALGGGSVGIIALGGGALGIIAIGGGAMGYIAIGGGAVGRYALCGNGAGKAVFSLKRQDPEAVAFFTRWLPRLKAAVTTPLPVVLLNEDEKAHERSDAP